MICRWLFFIAIMIGLPVGAAIEHNARKPVLYIVHSDSCPPCRIFDRVWSDDREFRDTLQDAFEVRELDWDVPAQKADAIAIGVRRLPTYVVLRGNVRIATHIGFAGSMDKAAVSAAILDLMTALNVEWPRPPRQPEALQRSTREQPDVTAPKPRQPEPSNKSAPPRTESGPGSPAPVPGESIDRAARDGITKLASQTRDLEKAQHQTQTTVEQLQGSVQELQSDVAGVKTEITQSSQKLSQQLTESRESTRSEVSRITDQLRETIRSTIGAADRPDISTEIPTAPSFPLPEAPHSAATGSGAASWLIKAGLTGAAVYFGLPVAGAGLGAAAVTWMLRRRSARKAERGFRPGDGATASAGPGAEAPCAAPLPRQLDEAGELLRLREREGRHPLHDALFGMLAETELGNVTRDPDPVISGAAVRLRDRITERFNSIAPLSTSQKDYVS